MDPDAWALHPERGTAGVMLCSSPHAWVAMSPGCSCRGGVGCLVCREVSR